MGNFIFNIYDKISVGKTEDYMEWALSYRFNNALHFEKSMLLRLKNKRPSKEDYEYLSTYQYIKKNDIEAVEEFLRCHSFVEIIKE